MESQVNLDLLLCKLFFSQPPIHACQCEVRFSIIGVQLRGLLVLTNGLLRIPCAVQYIAKLEVCRSDARFKPNCVAKVGLSLREAPQYLQGGS